MKMINKIKRLVWSIHLRFLERNIKKPFSKRLSLKIDRAL
ncbi:hypothetical protein [Methanosarcina virus MetMV]|nr:hypothetical protein [Methanosarcina virus MetMV]AZF90005.1 hypothetical protein [Methanosarcina virus MetMV]